MDNLSIQCPINLSCQRRGGSAFVACRGRFTAAVPMKQEIPHHCKDVALLVLAEITRRLLLTLTGIACITRSKHLKTVSQQQNLDSGFVLQVWDLGFRV